MLKAELCFDFVFMVIVATALKQGKVRSTKSDDSEGGKEIVQQIVQLQKEKIISKQGKKLKRKPADARKKLLNRYMHCITDISLPFELSYFDARKSARHKIKRLKENCTKPI